MPTFDDPIADSEQARMALRGLAHASRKIEFPGDAYLVIGNVLDGLRSLEQVLDQLANVHTENVRRAFAEGGDHQAGMKEVYVSANTLHQTAREIGRTHAALDVALQHSGRIVWSDRKAAIEAGEVRQGQRLAGSGRDVDRDVPGLGL